MISVSKRHAVVDCGLKALGMDHGNPAIDAARVVVVSDEHITFVPEQPVRVGDRIRVRPCTWTPRWRTTSGCTWWTATTSWRPGRSISAVGRRAG